MTIKCTFTVVYDNKLIQHSCTHWLVSKLILKININYKFIVEGKNLLQFLFGDNYCDFIVENNCVFRLPQLRINCIF